MWVMPRFPLRVFFLLTEDIFCGNREFLFPPKEGDPSKPSKRRQNFVCILFLKNVAIKTETRYIFWSLSKKTRLLVELPKLSTCTLLVRTRLGEIVVQSPDSWSLLLFLFPTPRVMASDVAFGSGHTGDKQAVLSGNSKIHLQKTYVL